MRWRSDGGFLQMHLALFLKAGCYMNHGPQRNNTWQAALEFVKQLGEALHSVNSKSSSHHLELIYVIPAPRMQKLNNQDFGPKDLMHLADTNPGPSAPLKWIHHSLAALLSAKGSSHSNSHSRMIFLGINFYGNDFLLSR
ncbi:hypothetical protein ACJX0J_042488, partial [Zea mays]